jgi:hypothetical protein
MEHPCQHCGAKIVGNAYRVTSEEEGTRLLDMIVCSLCAMEAKRLALHTVEVKVGSKKVSARAPATRRSRLVV